MPPRRSSFIPPQWGEPSSALIAAGAGEVCGPGVSQGEETPGKSRIQATAIQYVLAKEMAGWRVKTQSNTKVGGGPCQLAWILLGHAQTGPGEISRA